MEEYTFSGYCRNAGMSRIVICEIDKDFIEYDCFYPDCGYAESCVLIKSAKEKMANKENLFFCDK